MALECVVLCRLGVSALLAFTGAWAFAGPPFLTDDPEPVDRQHSEVNIALQGTRTNSGRSGPFGAEWNYGCAKEVQCHIALPGAYTNGATGLQAGVGDAELGVKYRLVNRTSTGFMAAVYPTFYLPTGSALKGLGNGRAQLLLPVWLQQSWRGWIGDLGVSYLINPAEGGRNSWYTGVLARHALRDGVTAGAELYHRTSPSVGTPDSSGVNVGVVVKLAENRNLLASVGRAFQGIGANRGSFYLAYQLQL